MPQKEGPFGAPIQRAKGHEGVPVGQYDLGYRGYRVAYMIPTPSGGGPDGVREETSLGPRGCPDEPQMTRSNNDINPFRTHKMISERERVIMRSFRPFQSPFGVHNGSLYGPLGSVVWSGYYHGDVMPCTCILGHMLHHITSPHIIPSD